MGATRCGNLPQDRPSLRRFAQSGVTDGYRRGTDRPAAPRGMPSTFSVAVLRPSSVSSCERSRRGRGAESGMIMMFGPTRTATAAGAGARTGRPACGRWPGPWSLASPRPWPRPPEREVAVERPDVDLARPVQVDRESLPGHLGLHLAQAHDRTDGNLSARCDGPRGASPKERLQVAEHEPLPPHLHVTILDLDLVGRPARGPDL